MGRMARLGLPDMNGKVAARGAAGAVLLAAALFGGPAIASWQLASVPADGSGRETRQAVVDSRADPATLRYGCAHGAPLLWIALDRDLARGMVESMITFDERKPQSVLLQVFSNPRQVPLVDIALADVARARRLRLDLQPVEAAPLRFDFDIRGARKAMAQVLCGTPKKSLIRRLTGRAADK